MVRESRRWFRPPPADTVDAEVARVSAKLASKYDDMAREVTTAVFEGESRRREAERAAEAAEKAAAEAATARAQQRERELGLVRHVTGAAPKSLRPGPSTRSTRLLLLLEGRERAGQGSGRGGLVDAPPPTAAAPRAPTSGSGVRPSKPTS